MSEWAKKERKHNKKKQRSKKTLDRNEDETEPDEKSTK